MALNLDNYSTLARNLSHVALFGSGPPQPPYGKTPTVPKVIAAVNSGENALPLVYRTRYAEPLKKALPSAMTNPDPNGRLAGDQLETFTGAVYQHAAGSAVAKELGRFLAVISNLYRSFLDKEQRAQLNFPLRETLPPLAVFQSDGKDGPFTVPVDDTENSFGIDVGVVSLPSAMRDQPILWTSLMHECGGHDVLHADPGLLDELAAGLKKLFGGGPITPGASITLPQLLSLVWPWWVDEAASDVYGLLNVGPTFAANLGFFFASFRAPKGGLGPSDPPLLSTFSGFDPKDPQRLLDVHPTDVLRLSLAIGVINSLPKLAAVTRNNYVADLRKLITLSTGGAQIIQLVGFASPDGRTLLPVQVKVPIAPMQAAAEKAGAFIATAKLQALQGHSIQEIETWDDTDEAAAQHISTLFGAGQSVVAQGDDAQLLAGATVAVLAAPDSYDAVGSLLNDALDDSFVRDPIWHPLHPDPFAIRSSSWGDGNPAPDWTITELKAAGKRKG
jgi:hypothetical protein